MGRVLQSPQIAAALKEVDLAARVVYFPVRHHSPACAWHVDRLLRDIKPDAVLIEGPRDATAIIPQLTHAETKTPVAIYTTFVQRVPDGPPLRHAAYYPMCDYSPEMVALRTAKELGIKAKFIDLTFPQMVIAGRHEEDDGDAKAHSLLTERHMQHSRFLKAACLRAGARDPDDLWDCLYETDYRSIETADFIRGVLAYCAASRADASEESLEADGTLARERAMAHAIAKEKGRVVVVTGGYHTVALPRTKGGAPQAMEVAPDDAIVVLMRYGFEQLDRLNGYSSGMPSPAFYQHLWEENDVTNLFIDLGRRCRDKNQGISVADEIAAVGQCRRLALMRGHAVPTREDLLDGVRSCFVKGAADADGMMVLAMARKLLAGDRVGAMPPNAAQPPIVTDFRNQAQRLRIDLDRIEAREVALDLYRSDPHRQISRLFFRLRYLSVPFARFLRGPDFVRGEGLERVQEVWNYNWSPASESALIEQSLYGATVEEAAAGRLMEQFSENEKKGQGSRADFATALVLEACRMGLHRRTDDLIARCGTIVARDGSFVSLVGAIESLMVLHVSREPLEAHKLTGVIDLAATAFERACFLLPSLASTTEADEYAVLAAFSALRQAEEDLDDPAHFRRLRLDRVRELYESTAGNPALRGAAAGQLFGDGELDADALARSLRGHLTAADPAQGCSFLRGLLRSARHALWQVSSLLDCIHDVLRDWTDDVFLRQLPLLRLALADLTPRECDGVAHEVAARVGVKKFDIATSRSFSAADAVLAARINVQVRAVLERDGLTAYTLTPNHA